MKVRVFSSLLCLATLSLVLAIQAQDAPRLRPGDTKPTEARDDAALKEQLLQRHFREFQEQVLKLKQRLERSPRAEDRERAVILQKVLDKAQDSSISTQFEKVINDLKKDNFSNVTEIKLAAQQAQKLADDLKDLVDLFRSDTRGQRLRDDKEIYEQILKNIEAAIRQQKTVQAQNDQGKTDPKELQANQKDITSKIDKIAQALENKTGQGGEAKNQKGEPKDGGKGEGKKGETKDQGKDGDNKKGETKDQGKNSEGKNAEAKGGDPKGGEPKGGEPKGSKEGQQGEAKAGQKGAESKEAGAKGSKGSEGKPGESKESKGDKGKEGEPKEGAAKDQGKDKGGVKEKTAEAKGGDKKEAGPKKEDDKQGEAKPGPKDASDKQAGDKDANPGADSKPGDSKSGGKSKQGEAKPGSKSQGQGEAKEGGEPKDGPQASPKNDPNQKKSGPQDPASGKVREAEEKSGSAEKKIADNKKADASKDQGDTIKKLEEAKKKLEDLLRQLREEEKERVLADLLKRCEKMLAMQIEVWHGTETVFAAIQKNDDKKPAQPNRVESARLSDKEKDIVGEASRAIEVLEAEGTAVAFPEVFQQVREDMKQVQRRLDVTDAGPVTQAIERDIIATLKEMIEALKKAQKDMADKKDPKSGDPKASQPKDDKLLEQIAELKMIRSMQLRVNARTATYGKMYPGEQAGEPAIRREVIGLSERQERIFEITNRIAKGDNK